MINIDYKNKFIIFFSLFIFSLFLRILLSQFINFNFPDSLAYKRIAEQFIENLNYDSETSMPLYPLMMALSKYLFGNLYIFDYFLSSLFPIIIFSLTLEVFKDRNAAIISGLISSVYPMNLFYSLAGLTENFYVFYLYLSFLFFYKKKFILGLIFLTLCLYTRAIIIYFVPIVIFCFLYLNNKNIKIVIMQFIKTFIIFIIFLSPWWLFNYTKYNKFVLTNIGTGEVLYLGNNEKNKTGGNNMGVDADFKKYNDGKFKNKLDRDKALLNDSIQFILDNPKQFLELSIKKFTRFWNIFPNNKKLNENTLFKYIIFLSYTPILLMSLLWALKNTKLIKKLAPMILFIIYTTLIHVISISSIRYRFPIEPILIILSSHYISSLFNRLKRTY